MVERSGNCNKAETLSSLYFFYFLLLIVCVKIIILSLSAKVWAIAGSYRVTSDFHCIFFIFPLYFSIKLFI